MNLTIHKSGHENNPAIIFLHGLGVSSWMWHDQIEALKDEYYCMAIDLPGNGESHQVEWNSFADTADQIAEIIQTETVSGQAHIVGLSLGGYTALHLARRHPQRLLSVIISGVSAEPLMKPLWHKPLSSLLSRVLKWKWMGRLSARMMQFPEDVVPLYMHDQARLSSEMIYRCYMEVLGFYAPALSAEAAAKLLITGGDKEAGAILKSYKTFAEKFSAVTVAQAPNAHHGWNGEHPDLFSQMIQAWISQQSLPAELEILHQPTNDLALA